jgi:hypothetical protein
MHHHCFTNFRRRHGACPSCSQDWPREAKEKPLLPVGEGAVRDGDDGKRRVRIKSTPDASEDDDEAIEDEPTATQSRRTSQRTGKGKASVNESMDTDEDEEDYTPEPSQTRRRSSRK